MSKHILETDHAKTLIEKFKNHHPSHGNVTDLLESMEDVKIFLAWIEPTSSPELFKAMKFVLGMAEQEGEAVEVEGIGLIDKSIARLVEKLNQKGYVTLASCSGLLSEHPPKNEQMKGYLSFRAGDGKEAFIESVAKRIGIPVERGKTYFEPSITIRITGEDDAEREKKWAEFEKALKREEGSLFEDRI